MPANPDLGDDQQIADILEQARRIAVIGMKPSGAAFSVPHYLADHGYEIVPVNPGYDSVGGLETVEAVDEIDGEVDIVDIFRRSEAIPEHVDQILAMDPAPKLVWFQLGIRNDEAARRIAEREIPVVQDKCIKVEHGRLRRNR